MNMVLLYFLRSEYKILPIPIESVTTAITPSFRRI